MRIPGLVCMTNVLRQREELPHVDGKLYLTGDVGIAQAVEDHALRVQPRFHRQGLQHLVQVPANAAALGREQQTVRLGGEFLEERIADWRYAVLLELRVPLLSVDYLRPD